MSETKHRTVNPGDLVPHFDVLTASGRRFSYRDIWQRQHLLLVALTGDADASYLEELTAREEEVRARGAALVATNEAIPGVPAPAALVADRWGEIVYLAAAARVRELPSSAQLLEWLDYLEHRCPECEGEAR
jgi:hypothetical protein